MTEKRWFVAQTRVHAEAKAAHHLSRQGFEIYLPRHLKRRRHVRKIETVPAPLFPRYLFVAADEVAPRWRAIQSTVGVSRLVVNGESSALLSGDVIVSLRQREYSGGFIVLNSRPAYSKGDKLRVLAGAFVDSLGLFDELCDRQRVAILLDLLGRKVRVTLDADMVAAA